jgi:hypothetical protein
MVAVASPASHHDREDHGPQLVHEAALHQRTHEAAAADDPEDLVPSQRVRKHPTEERPRPS